MRIDYQAQFNLNFWSYFRSAAKPRAIIAGIIVLVSAQLNAKEVYDPHLLDKLLNPRDKDTPADRQEIEIATAVAPFAIAANDAYERCPKKFELVPLPKTENWIPILPPETIEDIGFYAKAWIREAGGTKQLVIAYRGTKFSEVPDWTRGNLTTFRFFPWRTQYRSALDYALKVTADNPGIPVILTGHSLGGGLAESVQRCIPGSKAIVFHTSPNTGRLHSIGGPDLHEKHVLRVFEKGEVLRPFRALLLGWNPTARDSNVEGVRSRWFEFRKGDFILQHSMNHFTIDLLKLAARHNDPMAIGVLNEIADTRERDGKEPVDRWWLQAPTITDPSPPRLKQALSPSQRKRSRS